MKCSDCVFWILNRCHGEEKTCEYFETYDDWYDDELLILDSRL